MATIRPFFHGTARITGTEIDDTTVGANVPSSGDFTTITSNDIGEVAPLVISTDALPATSAVQVTAGGIEVAGKSFIKGDLLAGGAFDSAGLATFRSASFVTADRFTTGSGGTATNTDAQFLGSIDVSGSSYMQALRIGGNLTVDGTLSATISENVNTWIIPGGAGPTAPAINAPGIWIVNVSSASTGTVSGSLNFAAPVEGDRIRIFLANLNGADQIDITLNDGYVAADGTSLDASDFIRMETPGQSVTLIYINGAWFNENAGCKLVDI